MSNKLQLKDVLLNKKCIKYEIINKELIIQEEKNS